MIPIIVKGNINGAKSSKNFYVILDEIIPSE